MKTFIGKLAAAHNTLHGKKSIYLVPAKALAEEKFLAFKGFNGDFGLDIVISTRNRKEYDEAIFNGDFDIAIIVFKKFFQLLNSAEAVISKISLVVVDELPLIANVNRGMYLELLLTKLKLIRSDIQIIGLSAVIGNSRILPEWLSADLLLEHRRPAELRMGYVSEGIYHYQTFNGSEQGTEEFIPGLNAGDIGEIMVAVAGYFAESEEQSLFFLPDKDSTRPIYHQNDSTIKGHVFCSFLALMLMKELQIRIQVKGWKLEWEDIKRDLEALYEVELEDAGQIYFLRTDLVGICGKVFQAAGVAIPPTLRD